MQAGAPNCSGSAAGSVPAPGGYGAVTAGPASLSGNPGGGANLPANGSRPGNYSDLALPTNPAATPSAQTPPAPLTEFQKFVASTTGQVLPVYGAALFQRIPSTFAPLNMEPVPSDYVIGPGDELRIRLWGQVNFQANLTVDRSGEIYLPQVGPVHLAGLKFAELDAHLRQAVGRVYRNFDLTADLGQNRAIQIYVAGQAQQPGVYTVSSLSTLVDALFASGGPSPQGSMRAIELRRNGAVVTRFDLYDLLIRGEKASDAKLLPGDVIYIPPVGPQVAVTGSVRNPAIYELLPGEPLGTALAEAGGATSVAAGAPVTIERIEDRSQRRAFEVAYDATGLATALHDGDLIRVESIVPKYEKTVTLRGNVANPGRYAWREGMRLRDLIPDKESLLTRNYWWQRAQMGLPAPEFEPIPGLATMRQPVDRVSIAMGQNAGNPGASDATLNGPGEQNSATGGLSGVQSGAMQNQFQRADQRAGSGSLAEAQPVSPSQMRGIAGRTEVRLPAPEIDWDYAVIERTNPKTLKTVLIPFDLGKLVLHHDPAQNLTLDPGDIVTVFSQADIQVPVAQETKLVRLEGEFVHAGVYSVRPGETLRDLVRRAGGLTPNAYLYGSMFTRESTRVLQQARIDEYVQSFSLQVQRNAMTLAASSAAAGQGMSGGAVTPGSEQSLLASLRQIRATGRIVLAFRPDSMGIRSIPALPLEDGDRFVAPHTPLTVNIVGAVYDQNSFLFQKRLRVEGYLRLAGGPTRDADRGHAYVIRADGEVISRDAIHKPWGDAFSDLSLYPGDTIVVPEKMVKPSAMIGFMNWSQLFSQFALDAAVTGAMP